ncbi:MAG: hypothetical protein QM784_30620 [Polyangiaceae bacterium]
MVGFFDLNVLSREVLCRLLHECHEVEHLHVDVRAENDRKFGLVWMAGIARGQIEQGRAGTGAEVDNLPELASRPRVNHYGPRVRKGASLAPGKYSGDGGSAQSGEEFLR